MTQPPFSAYVRKERDRNYLVFEGAIDVATAPEAQSALQRFSAEHGATVLLDMSRVNFIDSRGLGALIAAAKAARDAGGQLYIDRPAVPVVKILETCQITSLFPAPPEPAPESASPGPIAAASAPRQARTASRGGATRR
jgi:anti-sigma B factor antagonist